MGESKYNVIRGGHDFYVVRHTTDPFVGGKQDGHSVLFWQDLYVTNYVLTILKLLFNIT